MYNLIIEFWIRTICCYLIGYVDNFKEYRFYYPNRGIKIVESNHVRFLKSDMDDYRYSPTEDMIIKKKISHCSYFSCPKKYHISS